MTGYGKASAVYCGKKITAEIKSLNSKALDLSTRVTAAYREHEMELRGLIAGTLERGKVEFALWIERDETTETLPLNGPVLGQYYQQLKAVCAEQNLPEPHDLWGVLLRLPDVMNREATIEEPTAEEWAVAYDVCQRAIAALVSFRKQEGEALTHKFEEKIDNIEALLQSIAPYEQNRTVRIKEQLVEALSAIPEVEYDKNRLEQEMIYYIEKLDINEEKQRLTNHLRYFRETLHAPQSQGKKLGFIAQEMGREINTTGSKSNQAEMQNIVVGMKDELEQIKEQVLNVL